MRRLSRDVVDRLRPDLLGAEVVDGDGAANISVEGELDKKVDL